MTDFSSDKLRELHEAATRGDLTTAERHIKCETVECPACQGDGELDAADYCNFDGVALGVQFYGIGGHFGAHEALWRYFVQSLPAILAMAEERRLTKAALADPNSVHVNMLRGEIAMPSVAHIIHLYGAEVLRKALGEEKS